MTESRPEQAARTAAHWDRKVGDPAVESWWHLPRCLEHLNEMLTGQRDRDFCDLLTEWSSQQPFALGVSFGSGGCEHEERLLRSGVATRMECWELSPERCRVARERLGPRLGDRMRVINEDFLSAQYPPASVEFVYVHGALHHIRDLEVVLDRVRRLLTREGVLVVDDFFGPTGMQWTEEQLLACNRLLLALPEELRTLVRTPDKTKLRVARPSLETMWAADPSECVRSSEMYGLIRERFSVVLDRPQGGAVFHPLLSGIAGNFVGPGLGGLALELVLATDRILTESGGLNSDYRFLICRP